MFFLFTRMLATLSATVAVLAMWFSSGLTAPTNVALGDIIRPVLDAHTLHLKVIREGIAANVYVQQPGYVRWEESPTKYRVAHGTNFWKVDGDDTRQEDSSSESWVRPDGAIDLLGLLEIQPSDRPSFDHLRPAGRRQYAGHDALVFTRRVRQEDRWLRLDLYADAKTNQFLGATARPVNAALQGPPLAELTLVAMNLALADDTFAVAKTLNVDGIGKVTDVQGIVTLRPLTSDRWTIVCRETPLQKGDWIRTAPRGANAAKLLMNGGATLVVGPGTILEIQEPGQVRLTAGECQIERTEGAKEPFTLVGPGETKERIDGGRHLFRVSPEEKLVKVAESPLWLKGFEGATANESIGSLIVTVDGRSEPLTVGEHKVTVDIRDQIARTTIEETFVNRTGGRLEGQFHFPLPQDASISGFGMWIGNQLVEADIVEKQRAREIFETILRENRDPGLLEWAGGNIFKARVFPIEPHSEKRIKITYTQVLPLRANRYRYSYGLRSELLQKFPLRNLSVQVNVHSAIPLKGVVSPTYDCRSQSTPHSARLDFTASEYTPKRDFEVVCEVDGAQSQVVAIPHRRGDDGYLMLQLMPPSGEGNWQREVLPSGEPADLLILCDTSGSMDSAMRKTQAEFVTALLSSLGPKDRFNVGVCDVDTTWLLPEAMTQKDETLSKIQSALAERPSLGWSDLDKAIASALDRAQPGTQIVYVGDGIVTGVNSDPQAFAVRVKQLAASRMKKIDGKEQPLPTIHSVSVGSTYESVALKSMASIGGGSMRQITGDQTPTVVAHELLNEILQPGLKDLSVEFKGIRVAAVYPERLPNLPAGMQQILVGRYLPEGKDQTGEVIVTGKRGTETVRYAAKINLTNAEDGNSFIPRLWARAHLDQLLMQGSSPFIQDEVIRLSEEFHIITPYTSLLVLETDADRARFGVKKRYEMRDGERFFADGKAAVRYDLAQQQMKRAGAWRQGLRRQILAAYARMGRNPQMFESRRRSYDTGPRGSFFGRGDVTRSAGSWGGLGGAISNNEFDYGGLGLDGALSVALPAAASGPALNTPFGGGVALDFVDGSAFAGDSISPMEPGLGWEDEDRKKLDEKFAESRFVADKSRRGESWDVEAMNGVSDSRGLPALQKELDGFVPLDGLEVAEKAKREVSDNFFSESLIADPQSAEFDEDTLLEFAGRKPDSNKAYRSRYQSPYGYATGTRPHVAWLDLFPTLSPPQRRSVPKPTPRWWTAEALEIARLLDRRADLEKVPGGLEIERTSENYHDSWRRMIEGTTHVELFSPARWLDRETGQGNPTLVHWSDGKERGVLSIAMHLGRVRPAEKDDAESPLSSLRPFPLDQIYRESVPTLERPAADRVVLVLTDRREGKHMLRLTIDTAKRTLLQQETLVDGKLTHTALYSDHIEVAGMWFPTRTRSLNGKGLEIGASRQQVTLRSPEEFQKRFDAELAPREECLVITAPVVKLDEARRRVNDGQANTADRLVVMAERTLKQQWDDVFQELGEIEKGSPNHAGLRWIRIVIERNAGRNEEARQHLVRTLDDVLQDQSIDALYRAEHILNSAYSLTGWNEYRALVERSKPIFERQKDKPLALYSWKIRESDSLRYTGDIDGFLKLREEAMRDVPGDSSVQVEYARSLFEAGRHPEAYAWLDRTLEEPKTFAARPVEWGPWDLHALHMARARFLRSETRWGELVRHLAGYVDRQPTVSEAYTEYLSALIYDNQLAEADRTVRQWFDASKVERKLSEAEVARFEGAKSFALNDIPHISARGVVDPMWLPVLEDAAKFFAGHEHHRDYATAILQHYRFQGTDAADRVRGVLRTRLVADVEKLPVNTVQAFVSALLGQRCLMVLAVDQLKVEKVSHGEWEQIAKTLRSRWEQEPKLQDRRTLAATLSSIYAVEFADSEHLPFLRVRLARAEKALADRDPKIPLEDREGEDDGDYVESERHELYEALLARPWTEAIEQELFVQLPKFEQGAERPARLVSWIVRLQQLIDRMLASRQAALLAALKDSNEMERLTRTELAAKTAEFEKTAREGVAARLTAEAAKVKEDADQSAWFRMERGWLDTLLGRNEDAVWGECSELLGPAPVRIEPKGDRTPEQIGHELSLSLLRSRALATCLHLAAKPKAPEDRIARVLAYIDAGIKLGENSVPLWRNRKLQFLIALDRVEDLERELRAWIQEDPKNVGWRLSFAKIRAERGDVPEAIALLEGVRKEAPLGPGDLAMLTDLYLAADRKPDYEKARLEKFQQIEEWRLSNTISQLQHRLQQHGGDVNDNLLLMFEALFSKASSPESYLYHLRNVYQATRDFRVLRMVPDLVTGRTREVEYRVLQNLDGQVLWDLKEAAADELLIRVRELRAETAKVLDTLPADAKGEGAEEKLAARRARLLDLRALDLIEGIVERRSSEVPNLGGVHAEAALAAFRRAFDGGWEPGERKMMATVLRNLGRIQHQPLIEEQLRELEELARQSEPLSNDALLITADLAHVLYWHYGTAPESIRGRERALTLLSNAIRDRMEKDKGVWPSPLNSVVSEYIAQLRDARQYTTAEEFLAGSLKTAAADDQRTFFTEERFQLWINALQNDGQVSLGTREELFAALLAKSLERVRAAADNERYSRIVETCTILGTAVDKGFESARPALSTFTFETFPTLQTTSMHNYDSAISHLASTIHDRLGRREELRFLILSFERYPPWSLYTWNDGWNHHASRMGQLRQEIGDIGDLEPPLLKLVLRRLRQDLRTREGRTYEFCRRNYGYFWGEKVEDFARTAEEVLAEERNSPRILQNIADYLFNGLDRKTRAIEVLFVAHRRGVLDNDGINTLGNYLHLSHRDAEAAPLYELLVDREPGNLGHRTSLMISYYHAKRPQQVRDVYGQVQTDFRKQGLWTDQAMGQLADACHACGLEEEARQLYSDAISRRQRSSPTRGIGDDQLSHWYRQLAYTYANLKKTSEAVEAASGAIVCWSPRHSQRETALETLRSVVQQSPDLDAYVATVDAKAKETGQDSPVIRSAIGAAWRQRNEWDKAITQLQIARRLQPNNREVNEALLACYDAKNDSAGATAQLLAMIDYDRRNLDLLKKLADRAKENPELAERAATSVVEAAPLEAANHQTLAELRQGQNRWEDAIHEWEQVAELQKLEPTGLVKLAAALVHVGKFDRADENLKLLRRKEWPSRFDGLFGSEIPQLEQAVREGKSKR